MKQPSKAATVSGGYVRGPQWRNAQCAPLNTKLRAPKIFGPERGPREIL